MAAEADVAESLVIKLPKGPRRPPEDSVELRVWVLAAILVGEVAVLTTGYFGPLTGVLVPLLTAVAFFVSHHRRREKNILIKVMLAFFALALLAVFFRETSSSLYDTRVPLARLFLWVQVIHAFDLPARKDTTYSLLSDLILLAVGVVLSTNLFYGLFIIAFLFCRVRKDERQGRSQPETPQRQVHGREGAIDAGLRPTVNLRVRSLVTPVPGSLSRFGEAL
jgi:protein-glutamine gamma-glutamyltransferase